VSKSHWDLINTEFKDYPNYIVSGKSITPEQALDVICCTDRFWWNFDNLDSPLYILLDPIFKLKKRDYWKYGIKCYLFLDNCWISGTVEDEKIGSGWCYPDGSIYKGIQEHSHCNFIDLYLNWWSIAKKFPFLELNIVFCNGTVGMQSFKTKKSEPLVIMKTNNGKVMLFDPNDKEGFVEPINPEPYLFPKEYADKENKFLLSRDLLASWEKSKESNIQEITEPLVLISNYISSILADVFQDTDAVTVDDILLNESERRLSFTMSRVIEESLYNAIELEILSYLDSLGFIDYEIDC